MAHDKARLWPLRGSHGVELFRATLKCHVFRPHSHPFFVIGIVEAGVGTVTCERGILKVRSGGIVLHGPGEVHTGGPAQGRVLRWRAFYLPTDVLVAAASAKGRSVRAVVPTHAVVYDDTVAERLLKIHSALEHARDTGVFEEMTECVGRLLRLDALRPADPPSPSSVDHPAVGRAREYLEQNEPESPSLAALGRECGLSPYHLARLFKKQMGVAPHRYWLQSRIEQARRLLSRGWKLADTAAHLGFVDQSHFTRQFKALVGVTPRSYAMEFAVPKEMSC